MEVLAFDDVELTYDVVGAGEGVVLIHAGAFVGWYRPLAARLGDFAVLSYRRRLSHPPGEAIRPLSAEEDAASCERLLAHLGWSRVHVVGHSYGALVALQLAIVAPHRVGSLALLEPAARGVARSEQVVAALEPVIDAYRRGDRAGAMDRFLRVVGGADYRPVLDHELPGAFDEAVGEADLFFQAEQAAVGGFRFGAGEADRITQPVLNVVGADTVPRFVEASALVQSWFPAAERFEVPGTGHLLMVQSPDAVAEGLRSFFARHPTGEMIGDVTRR